MSLAVSMLHFLLMRSPSPILAIATPYQPQIIFPSASIFKLCFAKLHITNDGASAGDSLPVAPQNVKSISRKEGCGMGEIM